MKGKVKTVVHGGINTEVTLELAGGAERVSVITKTSAEQLGLRKGKKVTAIIKASNIILATE